MHDNLDWGETKEYSKERITKEKIAARDTSMILKKKKKKKKKKKTVKKILERRKETYVW